MAPSFTICRGLGAAALLIALGSGLPRARAQAPVVAAPSAEWSDTERWVWSQLVAVNRMGPATLDQHCPDAHPDPKNGKDARWRNKCRTVSARFLRDLVTRAPWQEAIPNAGVQIDGARIDGDMDLENAKLVRAVWLADSRVEGDIVLRRTRTDNLIGLIGTFVAGEFNGDGLQSGSDLLLRNGSTLGQGVDLVGAKIGGQIDLDGATVDGTLNADGLEAHDLFMNSDGAYQASFKEVVLRGAKISGQVALAGATVDGMLNGDSLEAHDLFMASVGAHQASFKEVVLRGAKIGGQVALTGATVDGMLNGDSLEAHDLFMYADGAYRASFKEVVLRGAKIGGQVALTGATVDGTVDAAALEAHDLSMRSDGPHPAIFKDVALVAARIGGQVSLTGATVDGTLNGDNLEAHDLFMYSDDARQASFKGVELVGAKIGGQIALDGATVDGTLDGDNLEAHDLFMRADPDSKWTATFAGPVVLTAARIAGNLDLRGARLGSLNLSGASVDGELEIGARAGRRTEWKDRDGKPSTLTLQNAHVGGLADEDGPWPAKGHLQLDGFTFGHFGGVGNPASSMVGRGMDWWDKWARLDEQFSTTPYTQLGAALAAMGQPAAADEIRYLGRQRERDAAWGEHKWLRWFGLTLIWAVAGYGIGVYTFIVLAWVGLFTAAGWALLWFTVPAARAKYRGPLWCLGASLSRLLPVTEINKEFADFFNDPKRTRLNVWQFYAFSGLGIIGWVLAGILVAALSGLTRNP